MLEIAQLRMADQIDKAGIEKACGNLRDSGLFAAISYRYAPGPKKGYAVTLLLDDQTPLLQATIDIPGVDESEAWQWLAKKYGRFDRTTPQVDSGQEYLAAELSRHLASKLQGQHLVVHSEVDFATRRTNMSFQPETLPKTQSVRLTGNTAVDSAELQAVLKRVAIDQEYTDRRFAAALELNLRAVYEEHGFYRVHFTPGPPQWSGDHVAVDVAVAEGQTFSLGRVEMIDDNLPVKAMFAAAKLPEGKLANWRQIRQGILEMENVVKRTGYYEAGAVSERTYHDDTRTLDLRLRVVKGPMYHWGEMRVTGLSPELQAKARQLWRARAGDPYDYSYSNDFLQEFSRTVDFRNFKKYDAQAKPGAGDHVLDIEFIFQPR